MMNPENLRATTPEKNNPRFTYQQVLVGWTVLEQVKQQLRRNNLLVPPTLSLDHALFEQADDKAGGNSLTHDVALMFHTLKQMKNGEKGLSHLGIPLDQNPDEKLLYKMTAGTKNGEFVEVRQKKTAADQSYHLARLSRFKDPKTQEISYEPWLNIEVEVAKDGDVKIQNTDELFDMLSEEYFGQANPADNFSRVYLGGIPYEIDGENGLQQQLVNLSHDWKVWNGFDKKTPPAELEKHPLAEYVALFARLGVLSSDEDIPEIKTREEWNAFWTRFKARRHKHIDHSMGLLLGNQIDEVTGVSQNDNVSSFLVGFLATGEGAQWVGEWDVQENEFDDVTGKREWVGPYMADAFKLWNQSDLLHPGKIRERAQKLGLVGKNREVLSLIQEVGHLVDWMYRWNHDASGAKEEDPMELPEILELTRRLAVLSTGESIPKLGGPTEISQLCLGRVRQDEALYDMSLLPFTGGEDPVSSTLIKILTPEDGSVTEYSFRGDTFLAVGSTTSEKRFPMTLSRVAQLKPVFARLLENNKAGSSFNKLSANVHHLGISGVVSPLIYGQTYPDSTLTQVEIAAVAPMDPYKLARDISLEMGIPDTGKYPMIAQFYSDGNRVTSPSMTTVSHPVEIEKNFEGAQSVKSSFVAPVVWIPLFTLEENKLGVDRGEFVVNHHGTLYVYGISDSGDMRIPIIDEPIRKKL